MKNLYLTLAASALIMGLPACKSREERISEAVQEGNKQIAEIQKDNQAEINKAVVQANQEKAKAEEEIAKAQAKFNETKLEAEKRIDDAERKIDDKRIEKEREITDAAREAQKDISEAHQ